MPISIKEMRAALSAARVDFSDCFELDELRARYDSTITAKAVGEVESLRLKGNGAFKRASFEFAIRLYTRAIAGAEALPDPAKASELLGPLLCNRSAAHRALRMPAQALADAQMAVRRAPTFARARVRHAQALHAVGRNAEALAALEQSSSAEQPGAPALAGLDDEDALRTSILEASHGTSPTAGVSDISVRLASLDVSAPSAGAAAVAAQPQCLLLFVLPEDALATVLGLLDVPELASAQATCRAFLLLSLDHGRGSPWHHVCAREFPAFARSVGGEIGGADGGDDKDPEASAEAAPEPAAGELDWHVAVRERRAHSAGWRHGARGTTWLEGHAGPVYGVQLSGERLVTSSDDATIKVWPLQDIR